ncbi:glycosyltransferase [Candidatus Kaiserbacteria bacterium]|nr:glycosyltransferase [Candidatus Kaiserbacteria bacterium]
MKIYYVANARMPSEKAYAIQIAKVCEALVLAGADVEILAPIRGPKGSMKDAYHLDVDVGIKYFLTPPLYNRGRAGYFIESLFFMAESSLFLLWRRLCGEKFIIYTVDTDTFSYAMLPLVGMPVFIEVHDYKAANLATKFFFRRATGIIATTKASRRLLIDTFGVRKNRIIVEPNGVDIEAFSLAIEKNEAREKLGLPQDEKIALYVGRFYEWKGLELLSPAFELIPNIICVVVGGTEQEFLKVIKASSLPPNVRIVGGKNVSEIPLWLAASDALVILGTGKNNSSLYIAPMKIFENMAARRPVVVGATESHKILIKENEAYFYEPDDAQSLATAVKTALTDPACNERVEAAYESAQYHSWHARMCRILSFIKSRGAV